MANEKEACYRIAVIVGSVRPGNYTRKAVNLVVDELSQLAVGVDVIGQFNCVVGGHHFRFDGH